MSQSAPPAPLRGKHSKDLRFLETLQAALAGCRGATALYSTAAHRVAAAFNADSACLAVYDPITDSLALLHQARGTGAWQPEMLLQAVRDAHSVAAGVALAVPVIGEGGPAADGREPERRVWGALAIARRTDDGTTPEAPFTAAERQTLRAAAARIAAELERRRVYVLDDVLDGLLRKTKPIDVYTHSLRELRRFIRYDHSASVMTMRRGMAQITVRVEKAVDLRGAAETLVDSPRRGRAVRLTPLQTRYLSGLDAVIVLTNDGGGWRLTRGRADPGVAGLWRVLCLDQRSGEGAILCYPLIFGGQMLGILRLAARRAGAFDPVEQYAPLLDRFARLLAVTLYRSELYHQSDRQLEAIKEIGRVITRPLPVEEICRQVLALALRTLHVQAGAVGLLSKEGRLELAAHQGCTLAEPPILTLGEGISGQVVQSGRSRAVPDVTREPAYVVFNGRVCSELVAPITYDREVIGFLDVESFEEGRFREEDEEVITFLEALANQAAIAIKAAQLRGEAVEQLGATMAIDPRLSMAGLQDLLIDELRDKIELLAAANRAKSEFLAHMSHDLRGPLNVIVGLSTLLADPAVAATLDEEKQRESLQLIHANGEVLSALIGNILDLSVLEAGRVQLAVAPFAARPAFDYAAAVAQALAREMHKELDITVAIDPAISIISADEEKLLRVMNNLLSNAVKFTPGGGSVAVTVDAEAASGLHITVTDSGVGIAPEDHERVFEAFQQSGTPLSRQFHGTGLGLTVVRELVELHGGRIWLESDLGKGSAFHVLLPDALPAPARTSVAEQTGAPAETQPTPRARGLSVLVVEDIRAHMKVMYLALTSRGHIAHEARTGEEALAWLHHHRPDVILLDMQLPDMDGFRVAERIKARVETHAIPIIAVSADALSVTEERALASGCDAYLPKPIDVATLLQTIDGVVK